MMIYIGFGFLMTFLRTNSWSALTLNWLISIWCFQWVILMSGIWHHSFLEKKEDDSKKIYLSISTMVAGDFGAGSAMIAFGAVLGKCNLQ